MDNANSNIVVIILTLNQREMTLRCLDSLLSIQEPAFKILLWDNGSNDGTCDAVRAAFPDVYTHHSADNLGVAAGRNAAARLAVDIYHPAFLLFLDNDMIVESNFVSGLLEPLLQDDNVGQTQAKLRFMDEPHLLNDGGGARIDFVRWQVTPVGYREVDQGQYDQIKPCISCGGAMMVRSALFQKLDGFDLTFNPYGPEDLDFSLRLQKAGYSALYAPRAVAYHVVSHTFGKDYGEEYARHKSRQWFAFMRRHAKPSRKVAFFLFGAPTMAMRVLFREVRRGNLSAVRGLLRGAVDHLIPIGRQKEQP